MSKINLIKESLIDRNYIGILLNGGVEWAFNNSNHLTKKAEKDWGLSNLDDSKTGQWTTKIGEEMVYDVLKLLNQNPRRANRDTKSINGQRLCPDWETDTALYECKTRTYHTSGTAGEKILGTPWKYLECFEIYKKPLFVVCVGFQEIEAKDKFKLFNPCHLKKKLLEFYYLEGRIQYIPFTSMLEELLNYKPPTIEKKIVKEENCVRRSQRIANQMK